MCGRVDAAGATCIADSAASFSQQLNCRAFSTVCHGIVQVLHSSAHYYNYTTHDYSWSRYPLARHLPAFNGASVVVFLRRHRWRQECRFAPRRDLCLICLARRNWLRHPAASGRLSVVLRRRSRAKPLRKCREIAAFSGCSDYVESGETNVCGSGAVGSPFACCLRSERVE